MEGQAVAERHQNGGVQPQEMEAAQEGNKSKDEDAAKFAVVEATEAAQVVATGEVTNVGVINDAAQDNQAESIDAALIARLRDVLQEVDLSVTTEKMLRQSLEQEFGVDLKSKKSLIRSEVEAYLVSPQGPNQEVEEEGDDGGHRESPASNKRKRGWASRFGDVLSESMANFLGMERCPRTQVVKKLWEYIKANDLQDPKDKRRVLLDEKLKTIFPGKSVTMFNMQKHLSKHVFIASDLGSVEGDEDEEEEEEEEEEVKPKRAPQKRKAAAGNAEKGEKSPGKPNGFTKQLHLAPEMASWIGKETASRPEITKQFWRYVKEQNLQDPKNKQYILADDTLRALTGQTRFTGFGFAKLVKDKILGYVD